MEGRMKADEAMRAGYGVATSLSSDPYANAAKSQHMPRPATPTPDVFVKGLYALSERLNSLVNTLAATDAVLVGESPSSSATAAGQPPMHSGVGGVFGEIESQFNRVGVILYEAERIAEALRCHVGGRE